MADLEKDDTPGTTDRPKAGASAASGGKAAAKGAAAQARTRVQPQPQPARPEPLTAQAYVAEFVGTFLLVLFVCAVVTMFSANALGRIDFGVLGLLHALVLMGLVAAFGAISGGHFNPAVTIALAALRRIAPADAAIYVLVQLSGAIAGALVVKLLLDNEGADPVNYGAPGLNELYIDGKVLAGLAVEALGTFLLMIAIMGVAVSPKAPRELAPLVIGGALGVGVMAFAPLTGAGFNPARAFGPALVSGEFGGVGKFLLAYVAGPLIGALLAAFLYTFLSRSTQLDQAGRDAAR